jgi:hypothetical protein
LNSLFFTISELSLTYAVFQLNRNFNVPMFRPALTA